MASDVLSSLDNNVWSVDKVVSLEAEDKLVVVIDSEGVDLVGTTISLEGAFVGEVNGITVSLSSEEFICDWAERLEATNPWERVNVEVDVVDVSTETSTEAIEVLAVWGLEREWVTTLSTEFP